MELTHRITIAAPLDQTWNAFQDPGGIARCLPGLSLVGPGPAGTGLTGTGPPGADGGRVAGSLRIKLGSTGFAFQGSGTYLVHDRDQRRVAITAAGEDRRGNGAANLELTAVFGAAHDGSGEQTLIEVTTQLALTGRPGSFGHGVVADINAKLLDQFADCVATRLTGGRPSAGPAQRDSEPVGTGVGPIGGGAQSGGATGVGISSGAAEPPEPASGRWQSPTLAAAPAAGGLERHLRAAVIGAAGVVAVATVITLGRRLRG